MALVVVGVLTIASSSAIAAILAAGSDEPALEGAQAAVLTLEPPKVSPGSATAPAPAPTVSAQHLDAQESSAAAETPPEVITPAPASDVIAPPILATTAKDDSKPSPPKSPTSKSRPRPSTKPDPDPNDKLAKQLGFEIQREIKKDCGTLGSGKKVYIRLQIGSNGRVADKTIAAFGPLRACIEKAIGSPLFPVKNKPVELSLVIGKCVEAYGSTVSKCK